MWHKLRSMSLPSRPAWRGPPLALQMTVLLMGGLVIAQLVTLFLTLVFPPAPAAQYGLDDIATALADRRGDEHHGLRRLVQAGPPDVSGPGWLVSEKSRRELARLMNVDPGRVSLAFYTPLPFAGTTATRSYAMANDGPMATLASLSAPAHPTAYLTLAQYVPGQGAPQMGNSREALPPRDAFPPGMFPGGPGGAGRPESGSRAAQIVPLDRARGALPLISVDPNFAERPRGIYIPGDGGAAVPPLLRGEGIGSKTTTGGVTTTTPPTTGTGTGTATTGAITTPGLTGSTPANPIYPPGGFMRQGPRSFLPDASVLMPSVSAAPTAPPRVMAPLLMPETQQQQPIPAPRVYPAEPAQPSHAPVVVPMPEGQIGGAIVPAPLNLAPAPLPETITPPSGPPIAISAPSRGLFGLAPAPFVEGDFVAALQMPNGRWSVVQPAPEPFPNSWQQRGQSDRAA